MAKLTDRGLVDRVIRLHIERATRAFMPMASRNYSLADAIRDRKNLEDAAREAKGQLLARLTGVTHER